MAKQQNIVQIINKLTANGGEFHDGHTADRKVRSAEAFVTLVIGDLVSICPVHQYRKGWWVNSLNPIEICDDGSLELSSWALHTFNQRGDTLEEAVANFNSTFNNDGAAARARITKVWHA